MIDKICNGDNKRQQEVKKDLSTLNSTMPAELQKIAGQMKTKGRDFKLWHKKVIVILV